MQIPALIPGQVIRELLNVRNTEIRKFAASCNISPGYIQMLLMKHRNIPEKIHLQMMEALGFIGDEEYEIAQELALLRSLYHRNLIRASKNPKNNMKLRGRPFKV